MQYEVSAFYHFFSLNPERLEPLAIELNAMANTYQIRGLILLAKEGVNGTISGPSDGIGNFKDWIRGLAQFSVSFKDSFAEKHPFNDFKVKIKEEIVTLGRPDVVPPATHYHHLAPKEWHEALKDPNTVVIDTRNDYEVEIGKFKTAIDFKTEEFREFPEKLKAAGIAKNKKVLIYCTGGIRCEKALVAMQEQGYEDVSQLQGGILNYLQEFPNQEFEGECFVFDYRVAVDQKLQPSSKYTLCPHCGQPAAQSISCRQCGSAEIICQHCYTKGEELLTCSKNCAHHVKIKSRSKRRHQAEFERRHRTMEDKS